MADYFLARQLNSKLNELIGKPFMDKARGPNAYDCYGLALELWRSVGLNPPDPTIDSVFPEKFEDAQEILEEFLVEVPPPLKAGDLIVTHRFGGVADHVDLYVGEDWVARAAKNTGVIRMRYGYFNRKIARFFRPRILLEA